MGFPDDNCWYRRDTLARVLDAFRADVGLAGLSGQQQTIDGRPSMLRWSTTARPVTRSNFMRTTIMSTMFFRREALPGLAPFDEGMGVGSTGWYGAGEESDLLLRVLAAGGRFHYDPAIVVLQDEPRDKPDVAYVQKMLRYGCGNGHVWRLHRLSRSHLLWYAVRKVGSVALRAATGRRQLAQADLAYVRGTWAGYVDRQPRDWPPGS